MDENTIMLTSAAIQAGSTIVLVLITAFYAYQTYRTNQLVSKQVLPKITFKPTSLEIHLTPKDEFERLRENSGHSRSINFKLTCNIHNISAIAGSISRPILIVSDREKEFSFRAKEKRHAKETYSPDVIYLQAGEKKMEESVYSDFLDHENLDKYQNVYAENKSLSFYIEYEDENGQFQKVDINHLV